MGVGCGSRGRHLLLGLKPLVNISLSPSAPLTDFKALDLRSITCYQGLGRRLFWKVWIYFQDEHLLVEFGASFGFATHHLPSGFDFTTFHVSHGLLVSVRHPQ